MHTSVFHPTGTTHRSAKTAIASAAAMLAASVVTAHAANLSEVTVSAPVIGYEYATGQSIRRITAKANVSYDPTTLRTPSGVAQLKRRIDATARELCSARNPFGQGDQPCVQQAVESAQLQLDGAIDLASMGRQG